LTKRNPQVYSNGESRLHGEKGMQLIQWLKSRVYLQRILLSFMLVVVMLIVTAVVLYLNAQNKVLSMQDEADRKLMTQMNYNIENMNQIVKDLAISLYNDEDLIHWRIEHNWDLLSSGYDFEFHRK
jgi:hypothetical protein